MTSTTATEDRLRLAWHSARERARGERQAAEWTRDDLKSDLVRVRCAVARYLGNALDGEDMAEQDLIAYMADAGVDLTEEIAAHRASR